MYWNVCVKKLQLFILNYFKQGRKKSLKSNEKEEKDSEDILSDSDDE